MATNNHITLTGNMGSEARIIVNESTSFAAFSLATTDSYKDEQDQWQDKETVWHNILLFSPRLIEMVKNLKKGTRITLTGSLSYRPFEVVNGDGEIIIKKEASIIGRQIELAPLVKKQREAETA